MARTTHAQQLVKKPWGHELIIENDKEANYCLKILHIESGKLFSWQFHKKKTETFYVTKGSPILLYGREPEKKHAEIINLFVGDSFKIYPYQWHQVLAPYGEDIEIMECSTFHEDSDTYRNAEDWQDTARSMKLEGS